MEDIDSRLWELERQFWLNGGAVYRQYLTEHRTWPVAYGPTADENPFTEAD